MNIHEKILNAMYTMKNDPKKIIEGELTYVSFYTYIEGYVDGINVILSCNLRAEITRYFESKGNIHTNYYWTSQIKHRNNDKPEKELIEILLDITEEYFINDFNLNAKMNEDEIKKKIHFWLSGLNNRPKMFVDDESFIPLYPEGFLDGINVYLEENLRIEISRWFHRKTDQGEAYHWAEQMNDYHKDSENVTQKLIEVVEEYFEENQYFVHQLENNL